MTQETFKLLDRFLSLHEEEVSGRVAALDGPLKARLRQCAEGLLSDSDRAVLCNEIKDNRGALGFLAKEIQTGALSRKQKKPNEPRTN